jgi:uncharacterized membrane protein
LGTSGALGLLVLLVLAIGPELDRVPIYLLRLFSGVLLLLFGMRWIRKAILGAAGIIALHDEAAAFAAETTNLKRAAPRQGIRPDWIARVTAFEAVVLAGLEVVFIVLAVGAGHGLLWPAGLGALIACVLALAIGLFVQRPLARIPENSLKFGVGVMLSAFGVFWTGEGGHRLPRP